MSQNQPDQFNTHADAPLDTPGVPAQEDLEQTDVDESLEQDPEEVPNAHKPELRERATED
jgi:hypothetical protein